MAKVQEVIRLEGAYLNINKVIYDKAIANITVLKRNKTEKPNMNACYFNHLIVNKGSKNKHWRKDSLQQMVLEKQILHL